jgi:hypothetical protein
MTYISYPIYVSFVFWVANVVILLAILVWNRLEGDRPSRTAKPVQRPPGQDLLDASDILGWEFEYARTTASEAMQDRHTMINFYLLIAGVFLGRRCCTGARHGPSENRRNRAPVAAMRYRLALFPEAHSPALGLARQRPRDESDQGFLHPARERI